MVDTTIFNAQNYEDQATIQYTFNGVEKTIDGADTFHHFAINRNLLDVSGETQEEKNKELIEYIETKILSQALLTSKLTELSSGDADFISFCRIVFRQAFSDDNQLTVSELRDIIADFLTEITLTDDDWFTNPPIEYTKFQSDVIQKVEEEGLFNEFYFAVLYSGLYRFSEVSDMYNEANNGSSDLLDKFGKEDEIDMGDDTDDDKTEFFDSNLIGFVVRNNPEYYDEDDSISFEGMSPKEIQQLYAKYLKPYFFTDGFEDTIKSFAMAVSQDEPNTKELLRYFAKHIDVKQEKDEDEIIDVEIPSHIQSFLDQTPLIHHKLLMYVTDTIYNNE